MFGEILKDGFYVNFKNILFNYLLIITIIKAADNMKNENNLKLHDHLYCIYIFFLKKIHNFILKIMVMLLWHYNVIIIIS